MLVAGAPDAELGKAAADSFKRVRYADLAAKEWGNPKRLRSLLWVEPFVEAKPFWHPVSQ